MKCIEGISTIIPAYCPSVDYCLLSHLSTYPSSGQPVQRNDDKWGNLNWSYTTHPNNPDGRCAHRLSVVSSYFLTPTNTQNISNPSASLALDGLALVWACIDRDELGLWVGEGCCRIVAFSSIYRPGMQLR